MALFKDQNELDLYIDERTKGVIEAWEKKNGGSLPVRDPVSGETVDSTELLKETEAARIGRIKDAANHNFDSRFTPGLMQSEDYRVLVTDWFKGYINPNYGQTAQWRETCKRLAACETNGDRAKTIASSGSGTGAEFMPVGFEREVFARVGNYNAVRQVAEVVPVSGNTTFPVSNNQATAYYTAMATAPAGQSGLTTANVTLTPYKCIVWDEVDRKMFLSSGIDLTGWLSKRFGEAIAYAELNAFTNGNGTNQPTGFANHTSYSSVTAVTLETGLTLAYADLINLEFTPASQFRQYGVYMLSTNGLKLAAKLVDGDKRPIWNRTDVGRPGTLNGYPYVMNELISGTISISGANTTEIYFGDFKAYVIGDLQQYSFEISTVAGDAFKNDSAYVKLVSYNDGELRDQTAIDYLTAVHHL